jgi:hypothetical protein
VTLAVILSMGIAASRASAHHSHTIFYDLCKRTTIEGRIEKVEFKDPHTSIHLTLDDGAAYTVDWAGLRGLNTSGVIITAKKALVAGARAVVTGFPIRPLAEIRTHFPDFTGAGVNPNTLDLISIRLVGDSYSYARPGAANPQANCDGQ